jgi:hypothetical protein
MMVPVRAARIFLEASTRKKGLLAMGSDSILVFMAVVLGIGILGGLPIALYYQHERRKREMEHSERMKALELGRTIPGEAGSGDRSLPSKIAGWIGAGVPIGVFGCAWLASEKFGYHEEVWLAAALVGITAVICGSILVILLNAKPAAAPPVDSKPRIEEDAFDVVSGRG